MPTTTNYGWTTPADTDLVKDGASAIRTLGTAIDTTVFNNAGAAIAKSIVDAKGDLIVASGSDAVARLAVGTNDYVLTADSAATNGIKWAALPAAGGMTLINTGGTTLSGATTTISSIPSTYKNLQLIIRNFLPATDNANLNIRVNGTASSHGQYYAGIANYAFNGNLWEITPDGGQDNGTSQSLIEVDIFDYANTTNWKTGHNLSFTNNATNPTTHFNLSRQYLVFASTTAITSLEIRCSTGNFTSGTAYLYGVS